MAGKKIKRGGGRGKGQTSSVHAHSIPEKDYYRRFPSIPPITIRTRFRANQSLVLRAPIRCLNSHFSTPEESENLNQQVDPQPSSDQECATNFAPASSRCLSGLGSANVTEIARKLREDIEDDPEEVESALQPGFAFVNEHQVKVEAAPIVRAIFRRHGDITKGGVIKPPAILSFYLERLYVICNILMERKISNVTRVELENMLDEVRYFEGQKLNVGWLHERIEHAIKTQIDLDRYLDLKEEIDKQEMSIKKLEEEVSLVQQKLRALQEKVEVGKTKSEALKEAARDINARVRHHNRHSLLHGLL